MVLGAFENPFSTFTQGELEPQFASKESYFGENIKHVFKSNWRVLNEPLKFYSSINIIDKHSHNIWEHLGQFGDLDIKTSQRSK